MHLCDKSTYSTMSKQRKNRVKIEKKYKNIGRIPNSALNKICNYIDLPSRVQSIRASIGNTIKHNHRHIDELEEQLNQLGITKEGYAEFVAKNFNQIRLGNKPMSLVLSVTLEESNHIAALHLHYELKENFWLVTSVHAIRTKELEKIPLIWEKQKRVTKKVILFFDVWYRRLCQLFCEAALRKEKALKTLQSA